MTEKTASSPERPKTRAVGRPRRLTTEQVLEAGLAIGLEGLTMGAVAERLGVSIAVLYGYVSNREELVRLAASYATQQHVYPKDCGQHWALFIAEHAATLFALLAGPGQMIGQYFAGGLGPEVEIDNAETWLEALVGKGFSVAEALLLQRQMGEIVIGGAVTVIHKRALEAAGADFESTALRAMAAREPVHISHLLTQKDEFARRKPVWPRTLLQVLEAVAERRDERLDSETLIRVMEGGIPSPAR